ncbi:MAG: hypothetical protein ACRCS0_00790 [Albidovulum sp.]
MNRFLYSALVVASLAAPVSAEVCLQETERNLPTFAPGCAVQSAFEKSFGGRGGLQADIGKAPPRLTADAKGLQRVSFFYVATLRDDAAARALGGDQERFAVAARSFSDELAKVVCEHSQAADVVTNGGAVEFFVEFRLNVAVGASKAYGYPQKVHVSIGSCEAT